ncbi:MAG: hypothetical protein U9R53_08835 [Chloroflexota bacterium]|nr:hypothetical protein [Chloroflexota bacterium]
MYKEEQNLHLIFHIDTNRINSRSKLPAMNQLEQWHKNGVIHIELSTVAQKEAMAGKNRLRAEKALDYVYTETLATTPEEKTQLIKIAGILFPKEKCNSNQRKDIKIVFNAHKYSAILITNDGASKSQPGGILGHKNELKEALGIIVMSDAEAVEYIQRLINERDKRARIQCERYGISLPNWLGKD